MVVSQDNETFRRGLEIMQALVVGCGSIGKRHIENLLTLGVVDIGVCDTNAKQLKDVCDQYPVKGYMDLQDALTDRPQVTLICTPTHHHLPAALAAAKAGSHLFIEKPLSNKLSDDIEHLTDVIAQQGLECLVGCNMRFHPAVVRMHKAIESGLTGDPLSLRAHYGHYLPNWRPQQDYRLSYSSQRALGGGIILDAIHEIDYVQWFLGDAIEVFCYSQKISDFDIDVEDCADILIKFANDRVASIHLDFLDRVKRRSGDMVGSKGTMVWHSTGKKPEYATVELHFDNDTGQIDQFEVDTNEPYLKELEHLLRCIDGTDEPLLDIKGATLDLKIALAAIESMTTGLPVKVNGN